MELLGPIVGAGAQALFSGRQPSGFDPYRMLGFEGGHEGARNEQLQREFATMGIQWRVQDAVAAGLHPLYALGAATQGFTPSVSVREQKPDRIGNFMASMGQNIGRSLMASQSPELKETMRLQNLIQSEQLRGLRLRNDELEFGGIDFVGSPGDPPGISTSPVPSPVNQVGRSSGFDTFTYKPPEVTSSAGNDPSAVAGPPMPHWQTVMLESDTRRGPFRMDLPSKDVSEQWEALGESATLWLMTAQRNYRKYGKEWWELFKENYPEKAAIVESAWRLRHQGSREFMGDSNMGPDPDFGNRGARPSTMDQLRGR